MNLHCHRCGATLSASELFCPDCGSPQLKFAQQDETGSEYAGGRSPGTVPRSQGISWKDAIVAALLVAVPAGLLSAVSVLSWGCCLWVVGGAVLSIVVYHRRAPTFLLETRSGVRIGAVAGLIAAYSSLIATAIWRVFARYVLHQGEAIDQFMTPSFSNRRRWYRRIRMPRRSGVPSSTFLCLQMAGLPIR